jgi:hypothetical protein
MTEGFDRNEIDAEGMKGCFENESLLEAETWRASIDRYSVGQCLDRKG